MPICSNEQLINWRRALHRNSELSGEEYATIERITRWLKRGEIRLLSLGLETGVVAEIGEGESLIALRADIDALPVTEETHHPWTS